MEIVHKIYVNVYLFSIVVRRNRFSYIFQIDKFNAYEEEN